MAIEFAKRQPVLENPPLRLAICQMRFPRLLGIGEADLRPTQRILAERYPVTNVGRSAGIILSAAGVASAGEPEPVFQFLSDDKTWTVTATSDSTSLETTAYVDFPDFAKRWRELLEAVVPTLDLERQDRIGLRYVNELPCPSEPTPDALALLVRPEFVGVFGAHARTQRLIGSMHEQRFAQDSGVCTLRHGLVTKGPGDSAYILDMDLYDDKPVSLDLDVQMRQLAEFNHTAFDLFRWSIPPEHFATFNPGEVEDA